MFKSHKIPHIAHNYEHGKNKWLWEIKICGTATTNEDYQDQCDFFRLITDMNALGNSQKRLLVLAFVLGLFSLTFVFYSFIVQSQYIDQQTLAKPLFTLSIEFNAIELMCNSLSIHCSPSHCWNPMKFFCSHLKQFICNNCFTTTTTTTSSSTVQFRPVEQIHDYSRWSCDKDQNANETEWFLYVSVCVACGE